MGTHGVVGYHLVGVWLVGMVYHLLDFHHLLDYHLCSGYGRDVEDCGGSEVNGGRPA